MSNNSAAGSQPGPLPVVSRAYRADADHHTEGRGPYPQPTDIIVHSTVGRDSRNWLTTTNPPPANNVSAHSLARGDVRYDLVDFLDTAYAAGTCIPGISNANTLNLEIENLSGAPDGHGGWVVEPYDEATLNTAAHCVAAWMFSYAIPLERVHRHADVAVYPADYHIIALRGKMGRKSDPISLDWPAFLRRVQAWLTFFAVLPESEHAHYIQLAPLPPPDLRFEGPSTISPAVAERVLLARHSPIIAERPVQDYIDVCDQHGLNFAVSLAFAIHENGAGTQGVTAPLNNWGAVRTPQDVTLSSGIVVTALGPFVSYATWLNALKDWCARIKGPRYLGTHPEWTVRQALQVYAPTSDQNSPDAYYTAVVNMVKAWQAESTGH